MKNYRKMQLALVGLLPVLFCLTGCEGDHAAYTREEIEEYVAEETPLTEFTVSETPVEQGERAYWIISETGGIGLKFHVVDDVSTGLFSSSHYLLDDYDAAAVEYWIGEYGDFQRLHPVYSEMDTQEITDQGAACPAFCDTEEMYAALVGSYASRAELTALEDEADAFCQYLQNTGYGAGCSLVFQMDCEIRNAVPDRIQTDGDYSGYDITAVTDEVRTEAETRCILQAIDYRMEDWMTQFTISELESAVQNATAFQALAVCHGNAERDEYEYYPDLAGGRYASAISIRTLYVILNRERIETQGDQEHFTFIGTDGSTYEFSTAWTDGTEAEEHCYYKKDGATVGLDDARLQHINLSVVNEITGLNLIANNYGTQPNAGVYTESGHLAQIDRIYLNGEEMTYDLYDDGSLFAHTTDDYKIAYYDEEQETYRMAMDIGWKSDNGSYPTIIAEYINALGGDYQDVNQKLPFGYELYSVKWKLEDCTWKMHTIVKRDGSIAYLSVKKNGKKVKLNRSSEIQYMPAADWIITIPVDEFAGLFGLTADIDETEGTVSFY